MKYGGVRDLCRCLSMLMETAKDLAPLLRVACKDLVKDVELGFVKPRSHTRRSCVMYDRTFDIIFPNPMLEAWPSATGEAHHLLQSSAA